MRDLGGTILIVDVQGEANGHLFTKGSIPEAGLCFAHDANEAIRLARSRPFAHFIVNSELPDFNGLELFQLLKEMLPATPGTIFSDHYSREVEVAARNCGVASYLCKPLSREMLEALLS